MVWTYVVDIWRVPHWKVAQVLPDESDDTASSTDEDIPPYFIRSEKIVPHGFQHFAEQVCMGGTHLFHCSSLQEMSHPENIGRASLRSRTYHDVNESSAAMLDFINDDRLLEQICVQAGIHDDDSDDADSDAGFPHHIIHITRLFPTSYSPHHNVSDSHIILPTPYYRFPHHIPHTIR